MKNPIKTIAYAYLLITSRLFGSVNAHAECYPSHIETIRQEVASATCHPYTPKPCSPGINAIQVNPTLTPLERHFQQHLQNGVYRSYFSQDLLKQLPERELNCLQQYLISKRNAAEKTHREYLAKRAYEKTQPPHSEQQRLHKEQRARENRQKEAQLDARREAEAQKQCNIVFEQYFIKRAESLKAQYLAVRKMLTINNIKDMNLEQAQSLWASLSPKYDVDIALNGPSIFSYKALNANMLIYNYMINRVAELLEVFDVAVKQMVRIRQDEQYTLAITSVSELAKTLSEDYARILSQQKQKSHDCGDFPDEKTVNLLLVNEASNLQDILLHFKPSQQQPANSKDANLYIFLRNVNMHTMGPQEATKLWSQLTSAISTNFQAYHFTFGKPRNAGVTHPLDNSRQLQRVYAHYAHVENAADRRTSKPACKFVG